MPHITVSVDGSSVSTDLTIGGSPFYASTSFWNRKLDASVTSTGPWSAPADVINYGRQPTDQCAGQGSYAWNGNAGYTGIGYGPYNEKYATTFNYESYSMPIYCVDPKRDTPITVGIINHQGTLAKKDPNGIQELCNAVPWPDISKCPRLDGTKPAGTAMSNLAADGTDKDVVILAKSDPSLPYYDICWEFWVCEGGNNPYTAAQNLWTPPVPWTAGNAGYFGPETTPLSQSNGIVPNGTSWGIRAVGLGALGGLIALQDLRNVFNGGQINHAIAIAMPITTGGHYAPAVRGDGTHGSGNWTQTIPAGFPGAGSANPAYGHDQTTEGIRFSFDPSVDPDACSMPLARELTRAIRDYGCFIIDTAGCASFYIEDGRTLGSPYHIDGPDAVDPFALDWASIQPKSVNGKPSGNPLWDGDGNPIIWQMPWDKTIKMNLVSA